MFRLSFKIIFFLFSISLFAQSPHGDNFDFDCSLCHSSDSWKVNLSKVEFDHSATKFKLVGQHNLVDCRNCHQSLIFSKVKSECISCHKDVHQNTTSNNCSNCHTSSTWIVKDIISLHKTSRFPLVGAHKTADCAKCHSGYSELKFDLVSTDCYSCHIQDYRSARSPDHVAAKFSTECQECHNINSISWRTTNVNHSFFPLTGGHALPSCFSCHQQNTFTGLSKQCYSCHQQKYQSTQNPNHISAGIPTTCEVCHSINSWSPAQFNHDLTQFPLTGKHINTKCSDCHSTGYTGTPTQCYSCHQQDYQNATDPNHVASQFPTDCSLCHTTAGWDNASFDHNTTQFPLTGGHSQVACASCHANGYSNTSKECYSCHQQDFQSTTDPNHVIRNYSHDCKTCHKTTTWKDITFDHNITQFQLTGKHLQAQCSSCHTNSYTGTSTVCYSCHQSNYSSTTNPNHITAGIPNTCEVCHNTAGWSPAQFNHDNTSFPLTGAHIQVDCASCHANGYTGTSSDCFACHQTDYNNTTNPNHIAAGFPNSCKDCHTTTAWQPASFNHDVQYFPIYSGKHKDKWNQCSQCHTTANNFSLFSCVDCHEHNRTSMDNEHRNVQGYVYNSPDCYACHPKGRKDGAFNHATSGFVLTGEHLTAECNQCHQSGYTNTSAVCSDCHITSYNNSVNPNHQSLGISTDCSLCHTPTANWKPALFPQHNQVFELTGRHAEISNQCENCHNGNYSNLQNECVSCHQADYTNAVTPNHSAAGLPTACGNCHTASGWSPSTFSHNTTGFELIGAHQPLQCSSCHTGTVSGLNNQCVSCHQADYNTAPNHTTQSYPLNCQLCHNSVLWNQTSFDHQNTNFPLTGVHATTTCQQCHSTGYTGTSSECYSCHQTDYTNAVTPNHSAAGLPTACGNCHTASGWSPSTFSHNTTGFELIGAHQPLQCSSCHTGTVSGLNNQCVSCHQADYNTAPNHTTQSYPLNCQLCHNSVLWNQTSFDHQNTNFPLTGVHATTTCQQCHSTGYTGTSSECYSCHQTDYTNAVTPNHSAAGLPTACGNCHTASGWSPSTFSHSTTGFELIGAHQPLECSSCHTGTVSGLNNQCVSCHLADYNTAPNHSTQSYPTNCELCHNSVLWNQTTFNHQNTNFPLTGAHLTTTCQQCHSTGYTGTPTECYSCHQSDYTAAANHILRHYPTTCLDCHTTIAWTPVNFNHDGQYFPIYTGKHKGKWTQCVQCHPTPGNYAVFTCLSCHEHRQSAMDSKHQGVNGYVYNSVNCLNCHPNGNAMHAFNHNMTAFPLTGAHVKADCEQCHNSGQNKISVECESCHLKDYLKTLAPNHQAAKISTDCINCHNTANWNVKSDQQKIFRVD